MIDAIGNFLNLYLIVFDENGNVRPCGRDACIELIRTASCIVPDKDFGDVSSGFMNVDRMHKLYQYCKLTNIHGNTA